jgi:hypothetical protein
VIQFGSWLHTDLHYSLPHSHKTFLKTPSTAHRRHLRELSLVIHWYERLKSSS